MCAWVSILWWGVGLSWEYPWGVILVYCSTGISLDLETNWVDSWYYCLYYCIYRIYCLYCVLCILWCRFSRPCVAMGCSTNTILLIIIGMIFLPYLTVRARMKLKQKMLADPALTTPLGKIPPVVMNYFTLLQLLNQSCNLIFWFGISLKRANNMSKLQTASSSDRLGVRAF